MVKYDTLTYGDRADAGRVLANDLMCYRGSGAIVLTIPGSGIPVAVEAAKKIGSRLDIIVYYYPFAVASFYREWHDLSDEEVIKDLDRYMKDMEGYAND